MPKIKTHKGTAKRVKVRKGGTIQHSKAFAAHHLERKSSSRKRQLSRLGDISKADVRNIKKLIVK
jgi:large subunit ribosomal protein L35